MLAIQPLSLQILTASTPHPSHYSLRYKDEESEHKEIK